MISRVRPNRICGSGIIDHAGAPASSLRKAPAHSGGGAVRRGQWMGPLEPRGLTSLNPEIKAGVDDCQIPYQVFRVGRLPRRNVNQRRLFSCYETIHAAVGMARTSGEARGLCPRRRLAGPAFRHSSRPSSHLAGRTRGDTVGGCCGRRPRWQGCSAPRRKTIGSFLAPLAGRACVQFNECLLLVESSQPLTLSSFITDHREAA